MKINFHRNAQKSLEKLKGTDKEKIRVKILEFINIYEGTGIIPYNELQIKKLEGKWKGYYRMRIGKKRMIFGLEPKKWELNIFEIDNRGDIYK
ncbi:type II toxin-antitoxin system RelE/ParE family toxin [Bacteroidetes/Chlorobi group bacterium ChocPot_Mid]|nr:MAG: type II toxin-antitoxin system RelE/ParE family toxin [Bacteroidetes/Chlorobi group bacterium ChocPot_Mid]